MSVSESDRKIVQSLFTAMQTGPGGEKDLMALFTEDAVFVEPFTGQNQTHTGKEAIRASLQGMWHDPAPDLKLTLDRVDVDGGRVRADWTCTSPVFPKPMRGFDLFSIRDGKITRLEITVTEMPPLANHQ